MFNQHWNNTFIWYGSNIHSKEGKLVNRKIDPPYSPYIGLFHVAQDNQLDILGILVGEDITADRLLQSLNLAIDMNSQLLRVHRAREKHNAKKVPNFHVRNVSEVNINHNLIII